MALLAPGKQGKKIGFFYEGWWHVVLLKFDALCLQFRPLLTDELI